jgi:pilus assembly protein CpaE
MSDIRDIIERTEPETAPVVHTPAFATPAPPKPPAPKREKFVGFVADDASAATLHQALSPAFPQGCRLHVVDFRTTIKLLAGMTTPEIILIDLTGEVQPINAMMDLAEVVQAGTIVLAVGNAASVTFYRTVTKGMGVREYLAKPLTVAAVQRNFLELTRAEIEQAAIAPRGGRLIAVTGVRGGAGATMVAANLAWIIGAEMHRHTVLLDSDLHTGTTALALNVKHDKGLVTALETPERVDQLLIQRSTSAADERLHVLAAMESLTKDITHAKRGAASLSQALRARYNFVIADAGARLTPFSRDLLHLAHQRIVVLDPTMVALRNHERLMSLPGGPMQSPQAILVLNRAGSPGGLTQSFMEQNLGQKFDAVIPDLPRIVQRAEKFGQPAVQTRGALRAGIQKLAGLLGARALEDPSAAA